MIDKSRGFGAAPNSNFERGFVYPSTQQKAEKEVVYLDQTVTAFSPLSSNQKSSLWDIFSASKQIAKNLLPLSSLSETLKLENKKLKDTFLHLEHERTVEFDLRFKDLLIINGAAIFLDPSAKKNFMEGKAQGQKWIIYFNNNETAYETELERMQALARDLNGTILVFNYRGVGESFGIFSKFDDLILDGDICMRYLLSKGVQESDIMIHGHAMGAAVGMGVAELYSDLGGVILDRTFSCLSKAASARVPMSGKFLASFGWDIDAVRLYERAKAPCLIVYHKKDGVIPYHASSLYKALKERVKTKSLAVMNQSLRASIEKENHLLAVRLSKQFHTSSDQAHHYPIMEDNSYEKIKQFVVKIFNQKNS